MKKLSALLLLVAVVLLVPACRCKKCCCPKPCEPKKSECPCEQPKECPAPESMDNATDQMDDGKEL